MRPDPITGLSPLDVLFDSAQGDAIPLSTALSRAYGRLAFPPTPGGPHMVANFVETLDGVVSLGIPGKAGGGPISGSNQHDRLVMGLLRSVADAVVVGAGTLRSVPRHIWTPGYILPALADEYAELRSRLRKPPHPLNVIVSGSGNLDPDFAVFAQREVPVRVLTTTRGADAVDARLKHVPTSAISEGEAIPPAKIASTLKEIVPDGLVLLETGPRLTSALLAERALDELFITLAPQVAGRDGSADRPGLVSGHLFAPDDPRWTQLVSVRRAESYLFLRYRFDYQRGDQSAS